MTWVMLYVNPKTSQNFGFIRVTQKRVMINSNSFVDYVPLSAIIGGKIEALEALEWSAGEKLSGRIVITEKLNPFNNENPNQHLKMAGQRVLFFSRWRTYL